MSTQGMHGYPPVGGNGDRFPAQTGYAPGPRSEFPGIRSPQRDVSCASVTSRTGYRLTQLSSGVRWPVAARPPGGCRLKENGRKKEAKVILTGWWRRATTWALLHGSGSWWSRGSRGQILEFAGGRCHHDRHERLGRDEEHGDMAGGVTDKAVRRGRVPVMVLKS